jgi:hypothetical protein
MQCESDDPTEMGCDDIEGRRRRSMFYIHKEIERSIEKPLRRCISNHQ